MSSGAKLSIQSLLFAGAFAATVVSSAAARDQDGPPSSARQTTSSVAGLQAPGKILVDLWGIPHIYADNEHDLFFLQGFNAARDRLWQIDLWRKRGLGLLAKDFGAAYVDQDRSLRLFLYRGDMDRRMGVLRPQGQDLCRGIRGRHQCLCQRCPGRDAAPVRRSSRSPARCRIFGRRKTWCAFAVTD